MISFKAASFILLLSLAMTLTLKPSHQSMNTAELSALVKLNLPGSENLAPVLQKLQKAKNTFKTLTDSSLSVIEEAVKVDKEALGHEDNILTTFKALIKLQGEAFINLPTTPEEQSAFGKQIDQLTKKLSQESNLVGQKKQKAENLMKEFLKLQQKLAKQVTLDVDAPTSLPVDSQP